MKRYSTFFILILLAISFHNVVFATSYYSKAGQSNPNSTSSWSTLTGGTGPSPNNFTSGDVFIVQLGHSMTTTAPWTVSGTNAQIFINGGTLTLAHSTTTQQLTISSGDVTINYSMVSTIILTVNNGNVAGEDLLVGSSGTANLYNSGRLIYGTGATGKVSNTGTYTHTATINNEPIPVFTWTTFSTCKITGITTTLPTGFGQSFGNLIYDCPSQTVNDTLKTAPTTITNFTVNSTGTKSLVLGTNISPSTSLSINGGIFDLSSYTANGLVLASSINIGATATMRIGGSNGFPLNYSTHNLNSSSTVEYYGSAAQTIASEKYGNLSISGTRNGNISLSITDTISIGGILNLGVTFTTGNFITTGSIIEFSGSISQIIQPLPGAIPYHSIVINKNIGGVDAGGSLTLTGDLALVQGYFSDYGFAIMVKGNILGSNGNHFSVGSGKIVLTNGSSQHQISDVDFGALEINDALGAATIGSPIIKDLKLTNGIFTLNHILSITGGGKISATTGNLSSTNHVIFNGNGVVTGTVSFDTVQIYGAVDFGTGSTINGILSINPGGMVIAAPPLYLNVPTYGVGSTLLYASGGTFNRGWEWSSTSGAGYPYNVHINNNTDLNLGANGGTGTARQSAGNLTIDLGSSIQMNQTGNEMTAPLTVLGDLVNNGSITLSSLPGGSLILKGDLENNGSLISNNRPVVFSGVANQLITRSTAGTVTFDSLVIDKSSNTVEVVNSPTVALYISKNLTLQNGLLRLNGTITDIAAYATVNAASGNLDTVSNVFNLYHASVITGTINLWDVNIFGTVSFGIGSNLHGMMYILTGASVIGNAPTYKPGSTLVYNSGGIFYRGLEWSSTSGQGYPYNVEINNNTLLNFGGYDQTLPTAIDGNLVVMGGCTLSMNEVESEMTAPLTIYGSVQNYGNIVLSSLSGNDLNIQRDLFQSGAIFTPNGNTISFFGTGNSTIDGIGTVDKVRMNKSIGTLTLGNDLVINDTLFLTGGNINTSSFAVEMSNGSSIARTTGHINGNLRRFIPTAPAVAASFEIGDAFVYSPVSITFNNITADNFITASTSVSGPSLTGTNINESKKVNRYWTLSGGPVTYNDCSALFKFDSTDIDPGANAANFTIWNNDGSWNDIVEGARTSTSIEGTGIGGFGTFAIGEIQTFTITATAGLNGIITPSGTVIVNDGADTSFTITPDEGFQVNDVMVDGFSQGAVTNYNFTGVTQNHTIDASFTELTPTLNINAINGFVIQDPYMPTYLLNSVVTITAIPDPGYEFSMWSGDATGTTNPLLVTMDANKYITANFNFSNLVSPSVPTGFYAIAKNEFILLKWKKNPEADILRYRIYRDTFASPTTLIDSSFVATDTSKFIGGLINGTTYYFRIVAVDSAGNQSLYSIDDAATPMPEPGHALTLDGFGDYANALNPKLPQGNTPRTIEAWFRTTSLANQVIATWGNFNVNERACLMIYNGLAKYVGESNDLLGTIAVNDGLWHHVSATFDGTNLSIFVDGKFDVSAPMVFNTIGTTLKIGDGFNEYFDGQIDEIKIWDAARTQTEIQYSKDKTAAGDENGLVSYFRFDESSMPISFDGSPIGADLTLFGDAGFVTSGAMIPTVPTNLISYPGESQVYLFWNKNPEFDLYRYLIYGGTTANPTTLIDSTTFGNSDDTTAIINGLTNYTDYYFRVTAVDSTGIESAFSAEIVTQPIDQTGLPVPTSVQIIDSLQSNFTIHWSRTTGSDFRAYLIYGGTTPSPEFLVDSATNINDTSKVISGLTAGTPYYFFVTAIDTNGNESGSSNHVSATPYVKIMIIAKKFGNGIISPIDTTFVIPGNSLLYSFSPGNYYHFDSVLVDGIRNIDSLISYTFSNVVSDHTIDVYFSIDTYNLNVISAQGIVNKIPDSLQYSHGMEVQLTAVPNPGYSFSIWGGDTTTTNNPFTITVDTIKNITAFYALNTYSLTTNAVNGTVLKTPDSSMYSYGMPVVLIAIPDSGYSFIGWSGDTVELNNPITVTMYGEKNITANFSLNVYQITATVYGDGTIVPPGLSNVSFGDTVHYSFVPNIGSHFDSVVVNGVKIDSVNSYTFFNVTTAHSITAYFSFNVFHHFIVEAGSGGAINPQTAGQTFSIRTTAVDSLENIVTSFTGNVWFSSTDTLMGVLGGNFSIPFIAGQQGPQIIALYRAGNNTISVFDSLSGKKGTSSPFVVNPSGLSHFVVKDTFGLDILQQVQASPFPIKIIASDTYGNVQSDYVGTVNVTVSGASVTQGGGTTPNFTNGVLDSHVMEINTSGFFSIIVHDIGQVKSGASNFFVVVPNTYSINSSAVNGTISPMGSTIANYGDTVTFAFAPKVRHHFDSLYVDGARVNDSTTQYTFTNVISAHAIDAYFSANPNIPPLFTSVLSDTAIARFDTLQFQYQAVDPDSGAITFSLLNPPSGASIDSTGLLRFIPAANANGINFVVVQVKDDSLTFVNDTVKIRVNIYGDVSGNGGITAYDAALVLQNVVDTTMFTSLQKRIGDVSGNGEISALDASYLLQYSVGLISSFPGGLGKQQRVQAILSAFSFRIEKSKEPNQYDLYISVNKPSQVFGLSMDLGYDSSIVIPNSFCKTALTDSMVIASKFFSDQVKIAMAGINPMNNAGDIIKFSFLLKDPNYPKNALLFTMKKFILNETDHTNEIGGITLNVRDLAQLPTVYKLEQNFPNPFNPTTTISYQLPNASSVKIVVYNMLGQEVKTLINEHQLTGYYSMLWNGMDNSNRKVSSGVYIYRFEAVGLQNKRFIDVKKMMLIK